MACFRFHAHRPAHRQVFVCAYECHPRGNCVSVHENAARTHIFQDPATRSGKGFQVFLYYSFNLLFFDSLPELFRKGVTSELPQK